MENLIVGEAEKSHLTTSAKWAKFLSICMFIYLAIVLLIVVCIGLGSAVAGASMSEMMGGNTPLPAWFGMVYVIVLTPCLVVMFFYTLYLYRFAVKTRTALNGNDQAALNAAFANLGKYFRIQGVLVLIGLILMAVCLVGGFVAAIIATSKGM